MTVPATTTPTTPPAPTASPRASSAGGVHLNRNELIAGGGVLGAVLLVAVLRRRGTAKAAAATGAAAGAGTAAGGLATTNYAPVAGLTGSPDTTATDIQNFLQNQANLLSNQAAAGTTAAAAAPGFQAGNTNLIRNTADASIWQVQTGGLYHLSPSELASLGLGTDDNSKFTLFNDPSLKGSGARFVPNATG